jgi:AcrR family transcriptional regulator
VNVQPANKKNEMKQPTQRDLQAENRRNQLLDLALSLFAERGVENVSIKDLASEAHVAQGLIYYYFESKDALLAAVFQRHNPFPQVQSIIEKIFGLPVQEGLVQFTQDLARLMPEKRNIYRILLRELISPRTNLWTQALSSADTVKFLAQYFQERMDAGAFTQALIPIQMLSSFLISLVAEQPLDLLGLQLVETILMAFRPHSQCFTTSRSIGNPERPRRDETANP